MNKTYWIAGVLAVSIGAGATVMAQAKQGPRGKMTNIFVKFDTNGDGKVTLAEMEQKKKARFAAADTNGDAKISNDEAVAYFTSEMAGRIAKRAARFIAKNDADGDGMLAYDELGKWGKSDRMFSRIDADGDGVVSKTEFAAAVQHRRMHRGDRQGNQ